MRRSMLSIIPSLTAEQFGVAVGGVHSQSDMPTTQRVLAGRRHLWGGEFIERRRLGFS